MRACTRLGSAEFTASGVSSFILRNVLNSEEAGQQKRDEVMQRFPDGLDSSC